jgi:hypothetical protein
LSLVDSLAQMTGQGVIGLVAGKEVGVPTGGGNLDGAQDGAGGGLFVEPRVGMPSRFAIAHGAARAAIFHGIADDEDFRVGGVSAFLQLLRVNDELAEVAGEVDLLLIADIGVPEPDDAVLQPEAAHERDIDGVVMVKVEPFDVGTDVTLVLYSPYPALFIHTRLL